MGDVVPVAGADEFVGWTYSETPAIRATSLILMDISENDPSSSSYKTQITSYREIDSEDRLY
jgi:hypothetical protein